MCVPNENVACKGERKAKAKYQKYSENNGRKMKTAQYGRREKAENRKRKASICGKKACEKANPMKGREGREASG